MYQTRAGFQTHTHASNYLKTDGQLKLAAVSPPVDEMEILTGGEILDKRILACQAGYKVVGLRKIEAPRTEKQWRRGFAGC